MKSNFFKYLATFSMTLTLLVSNAASFGLSAFAAADDTEEAPETYTITLKPPESTGTELTGHGVFGAYQLFAGTVDDTQNDATSGANKTLSDITWGNGIRQDKLGAYIYALATEQEEDICEQFNNLIDLDMLEDVEELTDEALNDALIYTGDALAYKVAQVISGYSVGGTDKLYAFTRVTASYYNDNLGDDDVESSGTENDGINETLRNTRYLGQKDLYDNTNNVGQTFADDEPGFYTGEHMHYESGLLVAPTVDEDGVSNADRYVISGLSAGYYIIRDLTDVNDDEKNDLNYSYTSRMLFVVHDVEQEIKSSAPTLEKHIIVDGERQTTAATGVGDRLDFRLEGTLPSNYGRYSKYKYTFVDTPENMSIDSESVKVYATDLMYKGTNDHLAVKTEIKPADIAADADPANQIEYAFDIKISEKDGSLTVAFPDLKHIEVADKSGRLLVPGYSRDDEDYDISTKIIIEYTAVILDTATVGPDEPNSNIAQLRYSSNPYNEADEDYTVEKKTDVFVFAIDMIKYNGNSFDELAAEGEKLGGVKFTISRRVKLDKEDSSSDTNTDSASTSVSDSAAAAAEPVSEEPVDKASESDGEETVASVIQSYTAAEDGYVIQRGLFTGGNGVYKLVKWVDDDYELTEDEKKDSFFVLTTAEKFSEEDSNEGQLKISGLGANVEYIITEVESPENFEVIDPFTVMISAETDEDSNCTGRISSVIINGKTLDAGDGYLIRAISSEPDGEDKDGVAALAVLNYPLTDLPRTGGEGALIFYVVGGVIVAVSSVLIVISRKKLRKLGRK